MLYFKVGFVTQVSDQLFSNNYSRSRYFLYNICELNLELGSQNFERTPSKLCLNVVHQIFVVLHTECSLSISDIWFFLFNCDVMATRFSAT